jgi:hypothetical protein
MPFAVRDGTGQRRLERHRESFVIDRRLERGGVVVKSPKETSLIILAITIAVSLLPTASASNSANHAPSPSSPLLTCEIRQRAWCIHNGTAEVTLVQPVVSSDPPGRAWLLRDLHYPNSFLAVLEPQGCREVLADAVDPVSFAHGVHWREKTWDQLVVRLRKDGSCDLKLLLSPYDPSTESWAFSEGRNLLLACKDDACTPIGPTPADATDKYQSEYMKKP